MIRGIPLAELHDISSARWPVHQPGFCFDRCDIGLDNVAHLDVGRARVAGRVQVNSQPAGLDFLSLDWRTPPRATVTLDQPHAPISVEHVLGVPTFRRAADGGRQGFARFAIYADLNEGGDIAHDAARVHVLPLAEWMQVEDGTPWSFVRDDAVLQVTFRRDAARLDPRPTRGLFPFTDLDVGPGAFQGNGRFG